MKYSVELECRRTFPHEDVLNVRPLFHSLTFIDVLKDYEYPAHTHICYEMILVKEGGFSCILNGVALTLENGDALLMRKGDLQQDHLSRGQQFYVFIFELEYMGVGKRFFPVLKPEVAPAMQISKCPDLGGLEVLEAIQKEGQVLDKFSSKLQDSLLETLLWRTVRKLPLEALSKELRPLSKVERTRRRIEQVFTQNIECNPSVPMLAELLGLSPRNLTNLCTDCFGLAPARLLTRFKMERAAELLRNGPYRVNELSDLLCYQTPYHFSRVFKQYHHVAPSAWIRMQGRPPKPARSDQKS